MKLSKKQKTGVDPAAPTLKPVHPRRKELILLAGCLLVVIAAATYGTTKFYKDSGSEEDDVVILTEEQIQQSITEFDASQIEDSNVPDSVRDDIDRKIQDGDYAGARALIEEQLARTDLNDAAKELLNTNLNYVCTQTTDLVCVESTANTVEQNPEDESQKLGIYVTTARTAKAAGDTEKAKLYYGKALKIVNDQGGQDFVNTANQRSEEPLDYQELVDGAN